MADDKIDDYNGPDDDYDDGPQESLAERLWGLTEMFPEPVRNFTVRVFDATARGVKRVYMCTCSLSWILFTGSAVLLAPVIFELERDQSKEAGKQQNQSVLGQGGAKDRAG